MALGDVRINVLDGGLGLVASSANGIHCKVGVSSKGTPNKIVSLSSSETDKVKDIFGTGPLVNAIYDSFMAGASIVYAVKVDGDIPGTIFGSTPVVGTN